MQAEAVSASTCSKAEIVATLKQACAATGSDFDYLLNTAMRESSLKPQAKSSTSSASGLFQFIEQTWLGVVKQHGADHGLSSYANAITKGSDGRYHVADAADRRAILALRNDPRISSLMAGEFVNDTRSTLEDNLGRGVCGGELYAAHFLGPDAACKLIRMSQNNPQASAAEAFPAAAASNRNVFYNKDGSEKTVRQVYNWALKHGKSDTSLESLENTRPAKSTHYAFNGNFQSAKPSSVGTDWQALQLASIGDDDDFTSGLCSIPRASFVMTPGVMNVLASLTPDKQDNGKSGWLS
ncbi:MAG: lytic transglycosylase domain-containing protein [Alphaproteobacteria bacterium]|nr:lytic transglycosylase domain-containing protein [Alphaproteobacteria bacterium]